MWCSSFSPVLGQFLVAVHATVESDDDTMDARNLTISNVFSHGGNIHYILPHFQREYTWEKEQWETLLYDLLALYRDYQPGKDLEHFLGSIVVVTDGTRNGTIPAFKLVDGQQRLITVSLILCVLRELTKSIDTTLASKIEAMLINNHEVDDVRFKVFPSTKYGDRDAYTAIINGTPLASQESRITQAYNYFCHELREKIDKEDIDPQHLYEVLVTCFQVVFITLNNQNESPYKIFESLNAKGKPLSQADLVRNYIAMKLPAHLQEKVFERAWARIEGFLREQEKIGQVGELTAFLRHYLAMCRSILYSEEHIYIRFRSYMDQEYPSTQEFIEEIGRIGQFAEYYDKLLRPEHEEEHYLRNALTRLQTMEPSTAYPLLLAVYHAYCTYDITVEEFTAFLKMLENYMVRRYICAERTNNMNKWFPTLWREIQHQRKELSFIDACRQALSTNHYPSDRQVKQLAQEMKLYSRSTQHRMKITLILETIEQHLWAGTDVTIKLKGPATIEHVMPQTPTAEWKNYLGKNWQQTYEYVHSLGNLTLVTQEKNSQLSSSQFVRKKELLISQGLRINRYFSRNIIRWDEHAIRTRAEWLAQQIIEIWPSLTDDLPSSDSLHVSKAAVLSQ